MPSDMQLHALSQEELQELHAKVATMIRGGTSALGRFRPTGQTLTRLAPTLYTQRKTCP